MFMFFLQHACRCIPLSLANEISDWTTSNSGNIHLESESSKSKYVCIQHEGMTMPLLQNHGNISKLNMHSIFQTRPPRRTIWLSTPWCYISYSTLSCITHIIQTHPKLDRIDTWLDDIVWHSKVGWFRHPPYRSARPLYEELQQGVLSVREGAPKPPGESAAKRMLSILRMGVSENSVPLNPMVNDHYPY